MHERITKLKSSKEMEIKYMQMESERRLNDKKHMQKANALAKNRGRTEGETRINKLTKYLLEQERTEDLKKCSI